MSVEELRGRPDIVDDYILGKDNKKKEGKPGFSPYHTIAFKLRQAGFDGIRNLRENRADFNLNFSAFIFSVAVETIERTLRDGIFDAQAFIDCFNENIEGTGIGPIRITEQLRSEKMPDKQIKRMREFDEADKSHINFFLDPEALETLPQGLNMLFDIASKYKVLETIQDVLIPYYYYPLAFETAKRLEQTIPYKLPQPKSTLTPEEIKIVELLEAQMPPTS